MRLLAAVLWPVCFVAYFCGSARADIGGNPNGPGPCDYPSVGITGFFNPLLGRGEFAYCRFPQEINGAYYVQALGDYVIAGGFTGPHGGQAALGVGGGGSKTGYFCLADKDNGLAFLDPTLTQEADDPNPPGAWKSKIYPEHCHPRTEHVPPPPPFERAPDYQPPASNLNPALPQPVNVDPPK